jgi:hypothetical protein
MTFQLSRVAQAKLVGEHAQQSLLRLRLRHQLYRQPAQPCASFCGRRGSTRELVASANALGVFWGGQFGTQDGTHFEISRLP